MSTDFRPRTTYWIALSGLVLVTPFVILNIVQGHTELAIASLAILVLLVLNAWSARTSAHGSLVASLTLVPTLIAVLALVLREHGVIGVLWGYPAIITLYCMLPERRAWFANAVLLAVTISIASDVLEPAVAVRGAVTLLATSLFSAILVHVITHQQTLLERQVVTDSLTGLLNRHALAPTLERAIAQARQTGTPMALALLDLDHFKRINDEHGHESGDRMLRGAGEQLRQRVRAGDVAFRVGGEEFLVLLHGTDERGAARLADILRRAIREIRRPEGDPLTTSVGYAALREGESPREWIDRADAALYRAKRDGRDRTVPAA